MLKVYRLRIIILARNPPTSNVSSNWCYDVDGCFRDFPPFQLFLICTRTSTYHLVPTLLCKFEFRLYFSNCTKKHGNVYPDPYPFNRNNSAKLCGQEAPGHFRAKRLRLRIYLRGRGTAALLSKQLTRCRLTLKCVDLVFYWVVFLFIESWS